LQRSHRRGAGAGQSERFRVILGRLTREITKRQARLEAAFRGPWAKLDRAVEASRA